jgi:hypothetical protein
LVVMAAGWSGVSKSSRKQMDQKVVEERRGDWTRAVEGLAVGRRRAGLACDGGRVQRGAAARTRRHLKTTLALWEKRKGDSDRKARVSGGQREKNRWGGLVGQLGGLGDGD